MKNKTKRTTASHLKPLKTKYDDDILRWKSMSWLRTSTRI